VLFACWLQSASNLHSAPRARMGKKRQREREAKEAEEESVSEIKEAKQAKRERQNGGELNPPEHATLVAKIAHEKRLIVVLEQAHLETVKWGKGFGLLNSDEHAGVLRKHGRDATSARPDIAHQCLLMLLDSPLNRAGLLQVFVRTASNVLIEVNPQTRIPRSFPRFAGLMVQLLHKFSIKATDSGAKLLKVIKNPVSDHLPAGCRKILMSYGAEKICKAADVVPTGHHKDSPVCVVVGAIAKGSVDTDYTEEAVRIGNYPLSAAATCAKLTDAFEQAWGIL